MKLHANKPGMVFVLDDLRQDAVGRHSGETHAALLETSLVRRVDFVTMTMAFGNFGRPIYLRYAAAAREHCIVGAKPHGAAEIAARAPLLQLVALEPLRHQADDRFGCRAELCRVGILDAAKIACSLEHRHLHYEANAEIRHVALAGELRCPDFSFRAALTESTRDQNAVDVLEKRRRVLAFENLRLDPVEIDLHLICNSAMGERLDQRFVGVLHSRVFADNGDGDVTLGVADALVDQAPALKIGGLPRFDPERGQHLGIEAFGRIGFRHRIDIVDVTRLDNCAFPNVTKQRELPPLAFGDRPVGPTQSDIRLNADRAQFLDRVLGGLGLEFTRTRDERHQSEMDVDCVIAGQIVAELADRLKIRQAFDVTDSPADLAQDEVEAVVTFTDEILDGIGDVRDDLDCCAEVITAPLACENVLVDTAGCDVVMTRGRAAGEALVVDEVEVGFGAVVGYEDFAMLVGRHRAWIDVEVGIELAQADLVPARLQQRAQRRRSETLAE